jgi:hypothetical protein
MTHRAGVRSVIVMRNRRLATHALIGLALTAVFSLAAGHLIDFGDQVLGSGHASTLDLVGDTAGLIACATSAWYGLRHFSTSHAC